MAFSDFKNSVTRSVVSKAIDGVLTYVGKERQNALLKIVDLAEKVMSDKFKPETFDSVRKLINDPDSKWMNYLYTLIDEIDPNVFKTHVLNIGYQSAFYGYSKTVEFHKKNGFNIPWIILLDPTSACNMHCKGCWSAEYGPKLSLSYDELDDIITQGEELGIYLYLMTGGEPLVRKDDIVKLAQKHKKCMFYAFTNGTLVDEKFCEDMRRLGNISLGISVEGFEKENDSRRGNGHFAKAVEAMDLLKKHGLFFGTSICYTSKNYKTVTSDEFLDFLVEKGVRYSWYFHYMPVGNNASTDLLPTPEQREYVLHRLREVRAMEGGKPIFTLDFQNDGEAVKGCVAGGKYYCHINPNGDVEPCVFIHYSNANIREKTLLECLSQPLFREYQKAQPFNDNMLQPCPMLENPECIRELVEKTGAKSTDLQSPEDVHDLCAKCAKYANDWAPKADEIWNNPDNHMGKKKSNRNII
ncbi:MAG: radical SAM protein [Clostridiales bacterium]|nr:radical SAM protein [Clostridiales bacterium]